MTEQEVRRYLGTRFPTYRESLKSDDPLDGIVDSLGLFDIVDWIESRYKARIPNEEFSPRRLGTIQGIVAAIEEYRRPN